MVLDGVDEDGRAIKVLQHSCHVGVERVANAVRDESFAVLGAENEMDGQSGERLWHSLGRPFRALNRFLIDTQGVALG